MTQPLDLFHQHAAPSSGPTTADDPLATLASHAAAAASHQDAMSATQQQQQQDGDDNDELDEDTNDGSQPPSKRARTSQQGSRSRIAQACVVCRKKKIKCDGQRPACSYCIESNFPCCYTPPKRRGPPRKMPVIDAAEDGVFASIASTTVAGSPGNHPSSLSAAAAGGGYPTAMAGMRAHLGGMPTTSDALGFGSQSDPFRFPTDQEMDSATQTILHRIYLDPATGDLMHLRNLGRSNGAHFLRDDFPDYYRFGSLIADKPENVPLCSIPAPTAGLNNLNPEELPPQSQQDLLINFYFEYLRPLFPILEEGQVTLYLAKCQERNFYFEVQAFFAMCALWYVRMGRPRTLDFIHPVVHLEKAKMLLPRVFTVSPSLSRSCGLLMLAMALAGDGAGSSWAMAGAAIRVAQDVGLHMDLGRLPIHEQFKGEQVRRAHVVWWCCYVVDRMLSLALGRPVAIREEDCAVPLPDADPAYSAPRHAKDYSVLIRLAHVQGRISSAINRVRAYPRSGELQALSGLLEQWLAALPGHLRFKFQGPPAEHSPFTLLVNANYYYTVLLLYRPFLSFLSSCPDGNAGSPPLSQVTTVCMTTVKALLLILRSARERGVLTGLTFTIVHALNVMVSAVYLVWRNGRTVQTSHHEMCEYLSQTLEYMTELELSWPLIRQYTPLCRAVLDKVRAEPLPPVDYPAVAAATNFGLGGMHVMHGTVNMAALAQHDMGSPNAILSQAAFGQLLSGAPGVTAAHATPMGAGSPQFASSAAPASQAWSQISSMSHPGSQVSSFGGTGSASGTSQPIVVHLPPQPQHQHHHQPQAIHLQQPPQQQQSRVQNPPTPTQYQHQQQAQQQMAQQQQQAQQQYLAQSGGPPINTPTSATHPSLAGVQLFSSSSSSPFSNGPASNAQSPIQTLQSQAHLHSSSGTLSAGGTPPVANSNPPSALQSPTLATVNAGLAAAQLMGSAPAPPPAGGTPLTPLSATPAGTTTAAEPTATTTTNANNVASAMAAVAAAAAVAHQHHAQQQQQQQQVGQGADATGTSAGTGTQQQHHHYGPTPVVGFMFDGVMATQPSQVSDHALWSQMQMPPDFWMSG